MNFFGRTRLVGVPMGSELACLDQALAIRMRHLHSREPVQNSDPQEHPVAVYGSSCFAVGVAHVALKWALYQRWCFADALSRRAELGEYAEMLPEAKASHHQLAPGATIWGHSKQYSVESLAARQLQDTAHGHSWPRLHTIIQLSAGRRQKRGSDWFWSKLTIIVLGVRSSSQ